MTIMDRPLSRATAREMIFKQIAMLCAAGLLVWLMSMTYGLDLSPGFF
jgi:hypothetical protein